MLTSLYRNLFHPPTVSWIYGADHCLAASPRQRGCGPMEDGPNPTGGKRSGVRPRGPSSAKTQTRRKGRSQDVGFTSPGAGFSVSQHRNSASLRTAPWGARWKSTRTLSGTVSLFSCLCGGFDLQEAGVCLSARPRKTSGFPRLWKHWNSPKGSEVTPKTSKDLSPTGDGGETLGFPIWERDTGSRPPLFVTLEIIFAGRKIRAAGSLREATFTG